MCCDVERRRLQASLIQAKGGDGIRCSFYPVLDNIWSGNYISVPLLA